MPHLKSTKKTAYGHHGNSVHDSDWCWEKAGKPKTGILKEKIVEWEGWAIIAKKMEQSQGKKYKTKKIFRKTFCHVTLTRELAETRKGKTRRSRCT